jgi:phage terminase large subunit-like protein
LRKQHTYRGLDDGCPKLASRRQKFVHKRFQIRQILFDPWQMMAVAQRLTRQGLKIEEFPQSVGNLTIASQNLYELINGRNLVLYSDGPMRVAVSRAVAIETSRGWRISKEKQSHKIDVVIALAMAAHAAVKAAAESSYDCSYKWVDGADADDPDGVESWRRLRTSAYMLSGGTVRLW